MTVILFNYVNVLKISAGTTTSVLIRLYKRWTVFSNLELRTVWIRPWYKSFAKLCTWPIHKLALMTIRISQRDYIDRQAMLVLYALYFTVFDACSCQIRHEFLGFVEDESFWTVLVVAVHKAAFFTVRFNWLSFVDADEQKTDDPGWNDRHFSQSLQRNWVVCVTLADRESNHE